MFLKMTAYSDDWHWLEDHARVSEIRDALDFFVVCTASYLENNNCASYVMGEANDYLKLLEKELNVEASFTITEEQ